MRLSAAALFAAFVCFAPAVAAPTASPITAPAAAPSDAPAGVRVAMRQQTLAAGGRIDEHRQDGERFLFVVSGRLKVSNLVTGEEQLVEAGELAAERPGDWHVAQAMGAEPVTLYVIDRTPAADPGASGEQRAGN